MLACMSKAFKECGAAIGVRFKKLVVAFSGRSQPPFSSGVKLPLAPIIEVWL